jgi:bifunctional UDP-N-acetylglucosamine pyrophosphorylase/glucosamine-1-phosphate N-acetyltransferase
MLPILGKPIVERIVENLVECGLIDFTLVVSPDDGAIREYFQSESTLGVNIQFVNQAKQLGTADALKQAAPNLKGDFVLSACDTLISAEDVQRITSTWREKRKLQALLCLKKIPIADSWRTGIVTLEDDRITGIIEKPLPDQAPSNISSLPMYCFSQHILDYLPKVELSTRGEYELQDAIQMMIDANEKVHGMFVQNHHTLTTTADLLELNLHFFNNSKEYWQSAPRAVGVETELVPPLYIEPGVVIGSNCKIGPGVFIEENARSGNNVRLESVVVLRGAVIPDGAELKNQVVI